MTDTPKRNLREAVLTDAIKCVCEDRNDQYGEPEDSFARIANLWNAYLTPHRAHGLELTPEDVGWLLLLMKIARQQNGNKYDNFVDAAGYVACTAEIAGRKDGV